MNKNLEKYYNWNSKTELQKLQARAMAIINDLPNIKDLRDRAFILHQDSIELWREGKVTFQDIRYGFTNEAYNKLTEIEREIIKEFIEICSDCNCNRMQRIGDTVCILPNGEDHLSWCNQCIEFEQKYVALKGKYK